MVAEAMHKGIGRSRIFLRSMVVSWRIREKNGDHLVHTGRSVDDGAVYVVQSTRGPNSLTAVGGDPAAAPVVLSRVTERTSNQLYAV